MNRTNRMKIVSLSLLTMLLPLLASCGAADHGPKATAKTTPKPLPEVKAKADTTPIASATVRKLVAAGLEQTKRTRFYAPGYAKIDYPGGDISLDSGVCSDVVVRAFRKCEVDLQQVVHLDMKSNFDKYPKMWGLKRPDPNIDHRRVANLMTFFERKEKALPITHRARTYRPGDIVAWKLDNGLLHIGLVTNVLAPESERYQMVHNIGRGAEVEDVLFAWEIIGHYRYFE